MANGKDEVTYANARLSTDQGVIYEGGGVLHNALLVDPDGTSYPDQYYASDWEMAADTNGAVSVTGTYETGAFYKRSFLEAFNSTLFYPEVADERGIEKSYAYDTNSNVTFVYYSDDTFEAYCYDAGTNQVVRHRDRNGGVTKYVYNTAGQLIETHVGLVDGPSNTTIDPYSGGYNRCPTDDVQTDEYAVSYRQYHTTGDGIGKLAATLDGLGNQTDDEYDSSGRLVTIFSRPM